MDENKVLDSVWFTMLNGMAIGVVLTVNGYGTMKTRIAIIPVTISERVDAVTVANLGARFPERVAQLFFPQLRRKGVNLERPMPPLDLSDDPAAKEIVRLVSNLQRRFSEDAHAPPKDWEDLKRCLRREGFPVVGETGEDATQA